MPRQSYKPREQMTKQERREHDYKTLGYEDDDPPIGRYYEPTVEEEFSGKQKDITYEHSTTDSNGSEEAEALNMDVGEE